MKWAAVLVVCVALIGSALAVSKCPNPLLDNDDQSYDFKSDATNSPLAVNGTFLCPTLKNVCVPQKALDKIEKFWNKRKDFFDGSFSNISIGVNDVRGGMKKIPNFADIRKVFADKLQINIDTSGMENALNNLQQVVLNYLKQTSANVKACATKSLQFEAGTLCLAIDADWDQFVNVSANTITITYANDTCTTLSNACLPIFTDIESFAKTYADATINVLQQLPVFLQNVVNAFKQKGANFPVPEIDVSGAINGLKDVTSIPKLCPKQQDCLDFICSGLVGLKGKGPGQINNIFKDFGGYFGKGFSGFSSFSDFADAFNGPKRRSVEAALETSSFVEALHSQVEQATDAALAPFTRDRRSASTETTYSANGYNAVQVGSTSTLNTQSNIVGFSSASSTVASTFVVAAAAVAALLL
eukprot:Colp12_sorted_trinity150504_noHs@20362